MKGASGLTDRSMRKKEGRKEGKGSTRRRKKNVRNRLLRAEGTKTTVYRSSRLLEPHLVAKCVQECLDLTNGLCQHTWIS